VPTDSLAYNASYTITVTTDVSDLQGLHLENAYSATFTTASQDIQGTVINVPADVDSIQGGINLANDGDTVLVAPGTYYENINLKGKAITVASHFLVDGDTSHISNTIIDGSQPTNPDSASVVYLISGEDTTTTLSGFTISGGMGTGDILYYKNGGGIFIHHSGVLLINNKIINNKAPGCGSGGGIYSNHSNLRLQNVIISNNFAEHNGGGICSDSSNLKLSHVIIKHDSAARGGGISCGASNLELD
ncbi:MAG: hypothetical protein GWN00_09535, partial [Aliifodinibius sp.]|nr:hypothetical protein [Fodinibius sp.]NIV11423.1 hypothetical protein [Fodinibius sp.]NIY25033.1 hypothetical protein [Fodinibius sp.]